MASNLLVMGMPRSGTTLLAALIDSAPDAVCLSEPPLPRADKALDPVEFSDLLADDVAAVRRRIAAGEPVTDLRGARGERLTNYLAREAGAARAVATPRARSAGVSSADCTLAIKHNARFLAALPALRARDGWRTVALVRQPETAFAAWLASGLSIARGRFAVRAWPETAAIAADPTLALPERLAGVYAAIARRLAAAPPWRLVRYEALLADPAATLAAIGIAGADLSLVGAPALHAEGGEIVQATLAALRALDDDAVRALYPV